MTRARELERRRVALRQQIAAERDLLGFQVAAIEGRLSGVDRAVAGVRSLVRSPVIIVFGLAALALIGPSRLVRLASRSVVLVTAARRIVRLVR
ncbi:MAG TPA: YqjK family protein [Steroidobacteraceae bacterium]|nr:YqjK family protein [Steroidobacteraceae bacterium]